MSETRPSAKASIRTSIMGLAVAAVVYVAVLGLLVRLAIQPTSARLQQSGQAVLQEYRESTLRAAVLDSTMTDLWRLLRVARDGRIPLDTLEPLRLGIERLAETSNALNRLASSSDSPSGLRLILADAVVYEERLRSAMLGVVAALEVHEVPNADLLLRRADSLDAPLSTALNRATTTALQEMAAEEEDLGETLSAMNALIWVWLVAGALSLSLLALFLRRRLDAPLARLDGALDRIKAGDLGVHLEPETPDELGRLVKQFNHMAAILRQRAIDDEQRAQDRTAARTRLILEAALDAVVVTDSIGTIREWSQQAEQVFGWTRAEILDRRIVDTVLPPEYRAKHLAGIERYAATGESRLMNRRLELVALHKDGTRFPVEITVTPLERGSQTEFSVFVRDITERKRAQVALAESEARYRSAFEQAGVGMVEVDLDGRYIRVNKAMAELLGRTEEEVLKTNIFSVTHPDDRATDESAFRRMIGGATPVRRQKRYLRPDGTVATGSLTAALIRDSSGAPQYVLTVVQDTTAQRRLEEELRQAHKMDAIGQLAGGIAHDFNNLLTAIIGYAELLRGSDGVSEEVKEDSTAILATAKRGADLARNLLTLARTAPSRLEPVDVHQAINEVHDIAARTFDRRIELRVKLDAPRPIVSGDLSLLTNAFLNLALNARDAMPEGGRLTISTFERTLDQDDCDRLAGVIEPGPFIVVRIEDTGTGMTPDIQRRVFEPFYTNKPVGKGTGIGLSMVYGTVRSHSGAIELESTLGTGTSFTIYLPLRLEEAEEDDSITPSVLTGSGRILLAEDDNAVRDVATRMLQTLGYEVEVALDGQEAVERVAVDPHRYDLVILDGNMPRLHGREAASLIKEVAPELRLILATGYIEPGDAERLSSYGFSAAIGKPYSISDLSRVVAQQLAMAK
jgi:PAS domain S-box-containing protein